jgi:hypothetical protein
MTKTLKIIERQTKITSPARATIRMSSHLEKEEGQYRQRR